MRAVISFLVSLEVPAEDEPFVDATEEELAWMRQPLGGDESDPMAASNHLDELWFQVDNCPTEVPRTSHMMQWWFRWLRRYTGPEPPSRWADIRR